MISTTTHVATPMELLQLKSTHLLPGVFHFYRDPPHIVAGRGALLFDHLGKSYVDCLSGVGVMNAGHCQAEIIEPVIEQIRTLQHTTTIYLTEPQLRLAEALSEIAPDSLARSFFCASGSEAVEGAVMVALIYTQRRKVIAMNGSLHGRTRFAMSLTGLPMWRGDPFPLSEIIHVPFGDLDSLKNAFIQNAGQIAAVIAEPIQGNGGIIVPPDSHWRDVRTLCDECGALLIFDEVQTGLNRTGKWIACEHWNIAPDVMAISKGLGNGFPIAAFLTADKVAAACTRPIASTYGGNPVCATAALKTIEFHTRHRLGERATCMGERFKSSLDDLHRTFPNIFSSPRGMGLMLGLPVSGGDPAHAAARCDALLESLKDLGVLAGKTGAHRNVVTFMPPLIIDQTEITSVLDALHTAAAAMTRTRTLA